MGPFEVETLHARACPCTHCGVNETGIAPTTAASTSSVAGLRIELGIRVNNRNAEESAFGVGGQWSNCLPPDSPPSDRKPTNSRVALVVTDILQPDCRFDRHGGPWGRAKG